MCVDKLLKLEPSGAIVLELLGLVGKDFFDAIQHVLSNVLVTKGLEHLTRKLLSFILRGMDEVAVVSSIASLGTVEVLARHSSVVAHFYLFVRQFFLSLLLLQTHVFHVLVELLKVTYLVLQLGHGLSVGESELHLGEVGNVVNVLVALANPVPDVLP